MKFRTKPTEIEAEQFFRSKPLPFNDRMAVALDPSNGEFYVETAHCQRVYLKDGDWIVSEPNGKGFYPIKPDIFEKKYEPLDQAKGVRVCAFREYGVYTPYESHDGEVGWTVQKFDVPTDTEEDMGEIMGEFPDQAHAEIYAETLAAISYDLRREKALDHEEADTDDVM